MKAVLKKKKEKHSWFLLGIDPWEEYANHHSLHAPESFISPIDWFVGSCRATDCGPVTHYVNLFFWLLLLNALFFREPSPPRGLLAIYSIWNSFVFYIRYFESSWLGSERSCCFSWIPSGSSARSRAAADFCFHWFQKFGFPFFNFLGNPPAVKGKKKHQTKLAETACRCFEYLTVLK